MENLADIPEKNSVCEKAMQYARDGVAVFPCNSEKKPTTPHGFKDASRDPVRVEEMFNRYGGELIGMTAGAINGIVVVDDDFRKKMADEVEENTPEQIASYNAFYDRHGDELSATRQHSTLNGGIHYLFKNRNGLKCSAGQVAYAIDVRADGGYAMAPDDVHYKILAFNDIQEMSDELFNDLKYKYAENQTAPIVQLHKNSIPKGTRNNRLASEAGRLWKENYSKDDVLTNLLAINQAQCTPPLSHSEVKGIADSITKRPRDGRAQVVATQDIAIYPWPDPKPLPLALKPVPAFDSAMLPDRLRDYVMGEAMRMQCPPDFIAVGAMVVISSLVSRKAAICPKQNDKSWLVQPNLWGAIVGRAGTKKTPALNIALKPLVAIEARERQIYAENKILYEEKVRLEKIKKLAAEKEVKKKLKEGIDDAEALKILKDSESSDLKVPVQKRNIAIDATVEILGSLLLENPQGLLAYRDELFGIISSMEKKGQEDARSFYLQAAEGNTGFNTDRIGRGKDNYIPCVCLSLLGGIQPARIAELVNAANNGGTGDDGLMQRFNMLVFPDPITEYRHVDHTVNFMAEKNYQEVFDRLDAMQPDIGSTESMWRSRRYQYSDDAQFLYNDWQKAFWHVMNHPDNTPAMDSHLAKYQKLVPALSLLFALVDDEDVVSKSSLMRALKWADYLKCHAERVYASGTTHRLDTVKALLKKLKAGALKAPFKYSDIYLKGWSLLTAQDAVKNAVGVLCDYGYLLQVNLPTTQRGGRPTSVFYIHPQIDAFGEADGE